MSREHEGRWHETVDESEIEEGEATAVSIDGDTEVLLTRYRGRICACGNRCRHYGAPLNEGELNEGVVTCPWHFARYHVQDGRLLEPPALDGVAGYRVKVDGGKVMIGAADEPAITMPRGRDDRSFLIVGGGGAGNAAAEQLRREGFAGRITMITRESDRPYDRPMLSKGLLSGNAKASWLPLRGEDFYSSLEIDIRKGSRVASVDPAGRTVTLDGGETLHGDRVLLATGSKPRRLDIPGDDLSNVYTLRSAEDARTLLSAVERAGSGSARALVLGASFIGMEVAAELAQRGMEVHVAAPEDSPMSLIFGGRVGRRIQKLHQDNGVVFHMGTTARELAADGGGEAKRAVLSDGASLDVDVVVYGLGVDPVVDYLEGTGLVRDGALPVGGRLETEAQGVFAAGDIASVDYPGRTGVRVEHWVEAERQGRHAAGAMLGRTDSYSGVPFFWTRQYATSLKHLGFPGPFDRVAYDGDVDEGSFVAGYFSGGRLKGAAALGRNGALIRIERALLEGGTVAYEDFGKLAAGSA